MTDDDLGDAWENALKSLLDSEEGSTLMEDIKQGSVVMFNSRDGRHFVFGQFNNDAGWIFGQAGVYQLRRESQLAGAPDPYPVTLWAPEPQRGAPQGDWVRFYRKCKEVGIPVKWNSLAEKSGFSSGALRTAASRMKRQKGQGP
jgi:hypothetical protein